MRLIKWLIIAAAVSIATPVYAQTQASIIKELSATTGNNACVTLPSAGMGTGSIQVTGVWAGTITWYVSNDGLNKLPVDLAAPDTPGTAVNTTTANGGWSGSVAGWRNFTACMTSYTSGLASVALSAAATGGGGGAGGGAAGSVEVTEGGATAQVTATAGGALQVECVGGTCSSVGATAYDVGEAITVATANGLISGGRVSAAAPDTTGVIDNDFQALWLTATGALNIADGGSTISVDDGAGSITVDNGGTFAVQAAQSGTWTARAQDGSGNALTSAARGSERALSVQLVDGSGTQITTFGGGTQYTEADTDASITGTALMFEGAANALVAAPGTAANGLLVDVSRVTGTVTVSASNLDVQSGGLDLLDTTTFTTVLGSASLVTTTQADNLANTTDGLQTTALGYIFDGSTWDRWTGAVDTELAAAAALADNTANPTITGIAAYMMVFDGSTWDRAQASVDATQGSTITATGPQVMFEAKDQDGAALPNSVTEGQAIRPAATLNGVPYAFIVNEDGSATPQATIGSTQLLRVAIFDNANNQVTSFGGSGGTANNVGSAVPASATTIQGSDGTNTQVPRVYDADTDAGTFYTMWTALCVGTTAGCVEGGTSTNPIQVGDAGGSLTVDGSLTTVSTVTSLSQFAGNAINLGAGAVGTGTLRIVTATDDPVNDAAVKFDAQMVADDAASAGNPLYIGGLATSSLVGDAPVADGDRIGFVGGLDRVLIVRPHADLEDRVSGLAAVTDGSSTSLVAAQGAGVRFCATTFVVSNSSATNVTVDIRDGTAGSVIMTLPAAANMGGAVVSLQTPLCTTANTAMAADPSAAASTVTTTAVGFKTEL